MEPPFSDTNLDLSSDLRHQAWQQLEEICEQYYRHTEDLPVTPNLDKKTIESFVQKYPFTSPVSIESAIRHVEEGLKTFAVHTPHPKYFGLFNPRPNFAAATADVLTAFFNPQMAAWSHAPFAVEAELYVIQQLGQKFGYSLMDIDGVFTSGGAEANHTALLTALTSHFPDYPGKGLQHIPQDPVFYISSEGHHSFLKAAMSTGLGRESLRFIPVKEDLSMDTVKLRMQIQQDFSDGYSPFMVVATLGTTGVGAIDSLAELESLKNEFHFWLHADAAYGGGLILSDQYHHLLGPTGIADSITFDAHKWMSVPMAAGIFLTKHPDILNKTFSIDASYMPHDESGTKVVDPYSHSMQWSRRFTGLKVYLSMLVFGWKGYNDAINHQMEVGQYLRKRLQDAGFEIHNSTPLPIICFRPNENELKEAPVEKLHRALLDDRSSWVSLYPIHGKTMLRACITNYSTTHDHIDQFISGIDMLMEGLHLNEDKK